MRFDGQTYSPGKDRARLTGQWSRVWKIMSSGKWHTLHYLSLLTGDPEASISARIRDFRKPRFGGHRVERRRATEGGTYEYRLALKQPSRFKPMALPFEGDIA